MAGETSRTEAQASFERAVELIDSTYVLVRQPMSGSSRCAFTTRQADSPGILRAAFELHRQAHSVFLVRQTDVQGLETLHLPTPTSLD